MAEEHRSTHAKKATLAIAVLLAASCTWFGRATAAEVSATGHKAGEVSGGKMFAIAIHGGAGTLPRADISSEQEKLYLAGLDAALDAGFAVLKRDGTSLDATIAAVRVLEDNPLFNAGRGAVLNRDGIAELDASVMDGKTLSAGAVSGLRTVKSPIELARLVMQKSPHVMLVGAGAEEFAKSQGVEMVPNEYFVTPVRKMQLERLLRGAVSTKENDLAAFGTVGAVALDSSGNLAAATSTGGMTGKRWGRVGDSPIIGAGTYANNASCAVSATGHGEYFIRTVVAHDICAQVEYLKIPLPAASAAVLAKMKALGGNGGVIAIDPAGEVVLDFNSEGMFRGLATSKGQREVAIFR
jgi:beta-aspartyl-peptidase (threonine type)